MATGAGTTAETDVDGGVDKGTIGSDAEADTPIITGATGATGAAVALNAAKRDSRPKSKTPLLLVCCNGIVCVLVPRMSRSYAVI
jgi:hypothetical protein